MRLTDSIHGSVYRSDVIIVIFANFHLITFSCWYLKAHPEWWHVTWLNKATTQFISSSKKRINTQISFVCSHGQAIGSGFYCCSLLQLLLSNKCSMRGQASKPTWVKCKAYMYLDVCKFGCIARLDVGRGLMKE